MSSLLIIVNHGYYNVKKNITGPQLMSLPYSHSEVGVKKKQDLPAGASWTVWAQSQGPLGSNWQWFSKSLIWFRSIF